MSMDDMDNQENKENIDNETMDSQDSQSEEGEINLEDFATESQESSHEAQVSEKEEKSTSTVEALYEIPVRITAVIGTATMPVSQLVKLGRGAVVELDKKLGDAVDIYANNRLIARGEVVVVDDNHIGVTMTEIISATPSPNKG